MRVQCTLWFDSKMENKLNESEDNKEEGEKGGKKEEVGDKRSPILGRQKKRFPERHLHRHGNCYVIWRFKEWGQLKKHPECVHTMYKSYQFQWSRPWPLWWLDLIRPPSWNAQFLQNSNYLPQRKIHLAWIITWNDLDSGLSQQQFYSASTTCPRNFMAHLRHLAQQHLHGSKEGSHKLNSQIRQTFELIVILTCDCDRESELQSFLFPGLIVLFNKK